MKAALIHEKLVKNISIISKSLPSTSPVPVLLNVLLEATQEGVYLSATDLELGVRLKIPAKVEKIGAVTVPGKQFVEIINSITSRKVEIELVEEGVVINSENGRMVLQSIPKEEFPNLFESKGEKVHGFKKGEMEEIFSKLVFAVSQDDARPELTGVFVSQRDEGADFAATDGFRLSLKRVKGIKILEREKGIVVSVRLISEVISYKSENIEMYLYEEGNQVLFEAEDAVFIGRLIHGNFPNYERVIPKDSATKVTISREDFLNAIKLSSVFARESANIVKVEVKDKVLKISAKSSGVGEGEARVDVVQTGQDTEIYFNVKFLVDLLRNIPDKEIEMGLNSSTEPAVFRTADQEFLHVIMPVRVQD